MNWMASHLCNRSVAATAASASGPATSHPLHDNLFDMDGASSTMYFINKNDAYNKIHHNTFRAPQTPVVIRAHEKADHGTFVGVWDAAKRGGAELVSFSTVN